MRSPFGIFRKHGTILTAGLVALCMFAFTLADFLRPEHLPALLAMLAFGVIFYLLGQPSGKGGWYALVGTVLGFVVISFVPNAFGPSPAVTTTVGDLSEEELRELTLERQNANQFLLQVYMTGAGERRDERRFQQEVEERVDEIFEQQRQQLGDIIDLPQVRQQFRERLRQQAANELAPQFFQEQQLWQRGWETFAFAPLDASEEFVREDAVRTWVMAHAADDVGIRVSDAAVTEYLKKASTDRRTGDAMLTREKFAEFREELGVSESRLYDMLRFQIKAKQYERMVFPTVTVPPQQSWDFYKRGKVTQDLDFVSVPVNAFTDPFFPYTASAKLAYFQKPLNAGQADGKTGFETKGELAQGANADLVLDQAGEPMTIERAGVAYTQIRTEELAAVDTAFIESSAVSSLQLKPEVLEFFDAHKDRFPQGLIDPQEGWTVPVEAMAPEPAFGVPRRAKLAYVKLTIPEFDPLEETLQDYYAKHVLNYPDPSFSRPLEDEDEDPNRPAVAERLDRPGANPAVAEKPKIFEGPAWAEKREFLDFESAKEQVKEDWTFEQERLAREKNDERISQLLTKMGELSVRFQSEGDDQLSPTEVSEALGEYAASLNDSAATRGEIEYIVTELLTPKEMTATKIGQAVEVEIQRNPQPGQPKATVRTGGANVIYQVFRQMGPDAVYQPNQAIAPDESDTRYVFWKIEDQPEHVPSLDSLDFNQRKEIASAWKTYKGREPAKARAEEIRKALAGYFGKSENKDADFAKAIHDSKDSIEGTENLKVEYAPGFSWMEWDESDFQARLGTVPRVPKAGEKFMETAFYELDDDPDTPAKNLGVLVNADATAFYVAKVLNRRYGESASEQALLQTYLGETSASDAMRIMQALERRELNQLGQSWLENFNQKYQIQFAQTEPEE